MLIHGPERIHLPQARTLTIYLIGYFIVLNYKKALLLVLSYEGMSILGPKLLADPNWTFSRKGNYIFLIYLLFPFIVYNMKKILRVDIK